MADDGDVVAGSTTKRTTVGGLVFDVGEDGTFGDCVEGQDVADGESSVLSGVDELASVHALVGDESLGVVLELIWVAESDPCERSACWIFVSRAQNTRISGVGTHHDRNRGQSPLRHPGCIHCAQPAFVSPVSLL